MINDLSVSNSVLWKYVDDITLLESVNKNGNSTLQLKVDELTEKTKADGVQLNETKCKEVRITLCRAGFTADPMERLLTSSLLPNYLVLLCSMI